MERDRCPSKNATNGEHLWTIATTFDNKTGDRGVGIMCQWCSAKFIDPEMHVIAYFEARRRKMLKLQRREAKQLRKQQEEGE